MTDNTALYDRDFHAWATEQAALLRAGRVGEVDLEHLAEEIDSLGRAEKRELVNRLAVLLLHMLKWEFQPERRGKSWQFTIEEQRRQLVIHLDENPSLRAWQDDAMIQAYGDAVLRAERETGLPRGYFPWACLWTFGQVLDEAFWPGEPHTGA